MTPSKTFAYAVEFTECLHRPEWEPLYIEVSFPGHAVRKVLAASETMQTGQMRIRRITSGVELIELMMDLEYVVQPGCEQVGLDLPEA